MFVKFIHKTWFFVVVGIVIFSVYRGWFIHGDIIGGDWPYYFTEMVQENSFIPPAWGGGSGGVSPSYFLSVYMHASQWMATQGIPWRIVYTFFWFITPLLLLSIGGFILCRVVFPTIRRPLWALSSLILATNTYVLMIASGGQMGVFLGVSMAPLVFASFLSAIGSRMRKFVIFGLLLGIQFSLDPRIGYLTSIGLFILGVCCWFWKRSEIRTLWVLGLSALIVVLINSYWLFPLLFLRSNPLESLGNAYTTVSALKFFSFADFSHALSLLHPNWPDNVFGKTYFLHAEFLLLPLFAFSALLFADDWRRSMHGRLITVFSFISIIGVFFAKGANPPFGTIFIWMFEHVPGFVMFRDPTKFYLLIAIGYSVLIPYTLNALTNLASAIHKKISFIPVALFFIIWCILIRQSFVGSIDGTFTKRSVPQEYISFKNELLQDNHFSRTLWVPRQNRFAFTSILHPAVEAGPLLGATDAATLTAVFSTVHIQEHLSALSVGYIIIPYDIYGEIFQDDRRYNSEKRKEVEVVLDAVPWLTKIQSGALSIYTLPSYNDYFYAKDSTIKIVAGSADKYQLHITTIRTSDILFSQPYDPHWVLLKDGAVLHAKKTTYGQMSFTVPAGSYDIIVEFTPRRLYDIGRYISVAVFVMIIIYLAL